MRISDWSSDVCSSDLLYPGIDVFRRVDPIYEFPDAEIKDARIDAKHEFGCVLCERHLLSRRQAKIVTKFGANRPRPDNRRVGKEGGRTRRARWSPDR